MNKHVAIGGEFELDPALLGESLQKGRGSQPEDAYFSSGRAALFGVLKVLKHRYTRLLVVLPDYLCRSVLQAVRDVDVPFAFYAVSKILEAGQGSLKKAVGAVPDAKLVVLLINYFGLVDAEHAVGPIKELGREPIVILDNAQAFFEMDAETKADFVFTSYRKTLPTPDGAFVRGKLENYISALEETGTFALYKVIGALIKHQARVCPPAGGLDDRLFRSFFARGETELDDKRFYDAGISPITLDILSRLDLGEIARRRVNNFRHLQSRLQPLGLRPIIDLKEGRVPLFYPLLIKDRDQVRQALLKESIFCPVHWPRPFDDHEESGLARLFYDHELSLVIDQRYGTADMEKIAAQLEALGVEMANY